MKNTKELKWYEFDQNNSGGHFITNDKVCHRLWIEAESHEEAVEKAEELGCYWDGVANSIDCPCCGDRWGKSYDVPIDFAKYDEKGYSVQVYEISHPDAEAEWNRRYGNYDVVEKPKYESSFYRSLVYAGRIKFNSIEEYAQFLADEYGWTVPDIRLYYADGSVKEIFSIKVNN